MPATAHHPAIQREFPAGAFAVVIGMSTAVAQFTFATAPALLGVVRDASGGYGAVLILCMALQLSGSILVLAAPRR